MILFSYLFLKLKNIADKTIPKLKASVFDIVLHMRQDIITSGLDCAISTVRRTWIDSIFPDSYFVS